MLSDYCEMVVGFAEENDEIASKVGNYSKMEFADVYKPKNYPNESTCKSGF